MTDKSAEQRDKDAIRKAYLSGYEAGQMQGMQWMLKQLSKQVEISPEVLDQVTSAYQGLLKRKPEGIQTASRIFNDKSEALEFAREIMGGAKNDR